MKHHFEIMEEDGVDTDTTSDLAQLWGLALRGFTEIETDFFRAMNKYIIGAKHDNQKEFST